MKDFKRLLLPFFAILFIFTVSACKSSNTVDGAIDDFEAIVEKYEDLAEQDEVTKEEMDKLETEANEAGSKFKNLEEKELTPEQKKRVEDLTGRLIKAAFQVGMKAGFK